QEPCSAGGEEGQHAKGGEEPELGCTAGPHPLAPSPKNCWERGNSNLPPRLSSPLPAVFGRGAGGEGRTCGHVSPLHSPLQNHPRQGGVDEGDQEREAPGA